MNNDIKTYYIPINQNVTQGRIYTLYLNNNTNLDLASLSNSTQSSLNTTNKPIQGSNSNYTMEVFKTDYNHLLELNSLITNLSNELAIKINNFINEEHIVNEELNKINAEYQELTKKLTKEKGNS